MTGQFDCYQCVDFETVGTTTAYAVVKCQSGRKGFPRGCDHWRPEPGVDDKHKSRSYLGLMQTKKKLLFKGKREQNN